MDLSRVARVGKIQAKAMILIGDVPGAAVARGIETLLEILLSNGTRSWRGAVRVK